MKVILAIAALVLSTSSYGQQEFIDSCKRILSKNIHDTTRARVYIDLAEEILDESTWTAYNRKALNLANENLKTSKGKERKFYLRVKANAVGNIGYYYDDHGNKEKCLKNYFKALELYDKAGYEEGKASILGNIGIVFTDQGDYDDALDYLNKALRIKKKYAPDEVSKNYLNIGVVYIEKGDSLKALGYYKKALKAAQKVNDEIDMATSYNNIGSYHYSHKNYEVAIDNLRKAVFYYKSSGDGAGAAWAMGNLGASFLNTSQVDSAFYYTKEAERLAEIYDYPELTQSITEKLALIYQLKEDWEKAFKYFSIAVKMSDSLNNAGAQKEALRQKLEFDHNLKTAAFQAKRKEERKLANQRFVFILIGMILAVVFGIVIYSRLRIARKQKRTIEEQKKEVEHQHEVIQEKNKEIVDSINYAKRLQEAILPSRVAVIEPFKDAFMMYEPKDIVAGDFYWMHKINAKEWFIAVADCTGHGVPGAMVSVVCANALDRAVKEFELTTTGEILDKVAELVIERLDKGDEEVKDGMDIALCKVNIDSGKVEYSGAHNPLWIARNGASEIEVIKADRQPIGRFDGLSTFQSHTVQLQKGDWFYIFSDGYADQFGGVQGKKFKSANLKKTLIENASETGDNQLKKLENNFVSWKANEAQIDDVCVIGIKI